jgi:hypothetical protein
MSLLCVDTFNTDGDKGDSMDLKEDLNLTGRIVTGENFNGKSGAITFFPGDGYAWFHIDNGPAGSRPMGRMRFSYGGKPGDNEVISILQNGLVGIGNSNPQAKLDVAGDISLAGRILTGGKNSGAITLFPGDGWAWFHIDNGPANNRPQGRMRISHGNKPGDHEIMSILQNGFVGIGTSNPQATLDVAGDISLTGDIRLMGADCAEEFEVSGTAQIDPGSVLVINDESKLHPCEEPYDRKVAGVVSGADEYRPGIILGKSGGQNRRIPLALAGKVSCKVDARYSPVKVGDLLTTSPTPGYAMKAVDHARSFGAVIGKALCPLSEGKRNIPILVALQ